MAILPDITIDPTLTAIDEAIVNRESKNRARPYLGISQIGKPCSRELWYSFRWADNVAFDAATHKRFEDGHRDEDLMGQRIKLVNDIELWVVDPRTGFQFGVSDIGGHYKGHLDGVIRGILQAPKTIHVWEHKTSNEKKFAKLNKLKIDSGEKQSLKLWDEVYYSQAISYMYYMGFTRHYLTCSTPGGRLQTSCRTNASNTEAKTLTEKAKCIITSEIPLDKISDNKSFYICKFCDFSDICFQKKLPNINCRTCAHATAEIEGDGRWSCALYKSDIPLDFQRKGCDRHLYIPSLLPFKQIDANQTQNWIEYETEDKRRFRNGDQYYSSEEIRVTEPGVLGDKAVEALKKLSVEN